MCLLRPLAWPALSTALLVASASGCGNTTDPHVPESSFTHPVGQVQDSVPTPARPFGIAVSASDVVYVARLDADSLSRANLPGRALTSVVAVGSIPSHVTFNPTGTVAYSSNQGSHTVSVVDVATNTVTATLPMSSDAWNVIVSPDGTRLYATTDQGALFVFDTSSDSMVTSLTLQLGDALRGLAFDPTGRWLYIGGCLTGNVYVVDATTATLAPTLAVGGMPQHMAVSQDGAELYVADEMLGLDVVTLATGAVKKVTLAGGGYGLALSPDNAQIYVSIPSLGLVQIIDRATATLQGTVWVAGRPRGIAFSHSGATALIANEAGFVTFVR